MPTQNSIEQQVDNVSHHFKIVAGGIIVIGGALANSLVVRPFKRLFSSSAGLVGKKVARPESSFSTDVMPLNHE